MKIKLALFDIDKTIIKKDSMFLFLFFGLMKKPSSFYKLYKVLTNTVLYKFKQIKSQKAKEPYFYSIKYLSDKDLEYFYDAYLLKNIYKDALKEMEHKKSQGYYILLVSASPIAYMKYFEKFPFVDMVIGTELEIINNNYVNKIKGANCKGNEKVRRIRNFLKENGFIIDYTNSYAYSDSLSDLPMLNLVKNKYLINSTKTDIEVLKWS
jgi:phosphatidylglycerophosphatase C